MDLPLNGLTLEKDPNLQYFCMYVGLHCNNSVVAPPIGVFAQGILQQNFPFDLFVL